MRVLKEEWRFTRKVSKHQSLLRSGTWKLLLLSKWPPKEKMFLNIRYEVGEECSELGQTQILAAAAAAADNCVIAATVLMPVPLKSDREKGDTVPPNLATSLLSGHLEHLQIPPLSPLAHKLNTQTRSWHTASIKSSNFTQVKTEAGYSKCSLKELLIPTFYFNRF